MTDSANVLTLRQPDDWHLHLRDGEMLKSVVVHSARQFRRAIIMPNLPQPVVTTLQAQEYRQRILQALPAGSTFTPLMTLYLTDNTLPDEILRAKESGIVHGVKLYPAGATTHSSAGVTNLMGRCAQVLETMQDVGMPLLVHGEVTDPDSDLFDREAIFIDKVMLPLRRAFPQLKVVFEHLTTKDGVDYVLSADGPVAATITAHHLLYNRNAMFMGGIRPHYYCLPVLKRERHRQALLSAASSNSGRFFLGSDSAPHTRGAKENSCGCAGCYTALHALELYASAFDSIGRLDALEAFASLNGPAFYGLPVNDATVTLQRTTQEIPHELSLGNDTVVPLAAGETLGWTLQESEA